MAGDLNRATLVGRLGKDPETTSLQSGGKVVKFSVATSETWRDRNSGERKERTSWHNVVIWNEGLCSVAADYLRKGSRVLIEGAIETREWQDRDGSKRYTTEIVLRNFDAKLILLGSRGDSDNRRESRDDDNRSTRRPPVEDHSDEIPF